MLILHRVQAFNYSVVSFIFPSNKSRTYKDHVRVHKENKDNKLGLSPTAVLMSATEAETEQVYHTYKSVLCSAV